ncbi:two-component system, OmpR family, sensor histidine kinase ChvG [Rhodoblastus acidophilus]|uniref:histidine kinase n=2 Tax=Rhodoblastus acidophilus TaxID=1074 RepID=A0A212S4H4_RHOAC|nr:two-component system, OmpR family, sensor histidine kinase ChvG [Rhodoblastus acidophilus]
MDDSTDVDVGAGLRMKKLATAISSGPRAKRRAVALRALWRGVVSRFSSRLTRRIILLNLGGLVALLLGFLYLNQFRQGLIDARVQSLQTQSEIIAAAIAASATVDADAITIDPEKLLKLAPGQSYGVADETSPALEFSINPDRVGPLLRRLVSPTRTRARIYDRDGYMLMDSRSLAARSNILRFDLPAQGQTDKPQWWRDIQDFLSGGFNFARLPLYQDLGAANGKGYVEVANALEGKPQTIVRRNTQGETVISVATPIQRFRTVRGALLLSTQGGDIDGIIASERRAIFRIFLVSAVVMVLLSAALAGAIAEPIRRLVTAAEGVRRGVTSRAQIPDFTARDDEIGLLSGALRDMTSALLSRMEAIERFAADVAHELKNPLTSLRSAVETLPIAKTENSRNRLLDVIQHDVKRLDRLISDISDASRLDAELARDDLERIRIARLLRGIVELANQIDRADKVKVILSVSPVCERVCIEGHESRLGQVFNNLIDNARSFSSEGGVVRVSVTRTELHSDGQRRMSGYNIVVDDDGPGIPAHAFERIFERFYTDRPNQSFGNNSGLGLSISRQIVEAHGGTIQACNRTDAAGNITGARFTVFLPAVIE